MISRIIQNLLCALHRHGRFGRDEAAETEPLLDGSFFRLIDAADESHSVRFGSAESPCRETDVFDPARRSDHFGKTAEGANVRCQPDVDFFDGELGAGRAQSDVGACAEIDGETVAVAV